MKIRQGFFLTLQRSLQFLVKVFSYILAKIPGKAGMVTISLGNVYVLFHTRYPQERRHALDHEMYYFKKFLEAGGNGLCFWDIGANIGYFAVSYAKKYSDSPVLAFEPMPLNYFILQENITLNRLGNIVAHQFAIGDDISRVMLRGKKEPGWGGSSLLREEIEDEDTFAVDVFSVDHLCLMKEFPPPAIIKIDVEGFEMSVLKGMEQTLRAYRPCLFIELHEEYLKKIGVSLENAVNWIYSQGYRLEFMETHRSGKQCQCIFIPLPKA